jgi:hypothetical protein
VRALIFTLIVSLAFNPVAQAMTGNGRCGGGGMAKVATALFQSTSASEGHSAGTTEEHSPVTTSIQPSASANLDQPGSDHCHCTCCHCPPGYQCSSSIGLMSSPPLSEGFTPADPATAR